MDFQADKDNKVQLFNFDEFKWSKYLIIDSMDKGTSSETAYGVIISGNLKPDLIVGGIVQGW